MGELEKDNSNWNKEKSELENECTVLKEEFNLVTSELREVNENSKEEIELKQGNSV